MAFRADPVLGGVEAGAEGELRMPADALLFQGMSCGVPPARRDLDRRQVLPARVGLVPCGERGRVDSEVASPSPEEPALVSEADSDQDQPVTDLLQHSPTADLLDSCPFLPGHDHAVESALPTAWKAVDPTAPWTRGRRSGLLRQLQERFQL